MKRLVRLAHLSPLSTALVACFGLAVSGEAQVPANNDCSAAAPLLAPLEWTPLSLPTPNSVSTLNATPSGIMASGLPPIADELPNSACTDLFGAVFADDLHSDVWYTFTPAITGEWLLSTCDAVDWDSKRAIYSGSCMSAIAVACNDEGVWCDIFSSDLRATLLNGRPYLVQVGGGSSTATGSGTLHVRFEGAVIGLNFCGTSPNAVDSIGAVMSATGSHSVAANDLILSASPCPNEPALFFYSDTRTTNPLGFANYEGRKCVLSGGLGITRMLPPVFGSGNTVTKVVDNTLPYGAQILVGGTRYFQAWFRSATDDDSDGIVSGANYSDGYAITFTP